MSGFLVMAPGPLLGLVLCCVTVFGFVLQVALSDIMFDGGLKAAVQCLHIPQITCPILPVV